MVAWDGMAQGNLSLSLKLNCSCLIRGVETWEVIFLDKVNYVDWFGEILSLDNFLYDTDQSIVMI